MKSEFCFWIETTVKIYAASHTANDCYSGNNRHSGIKSPDRFFHYSGRCLYLYVHTSFHARSIFNSSNSSHIWSISHIMWWSTSQRNMIRHHGCCSIIPHPFQRVICIVLLLPIIKINTPHQWWRNFKDYFGLVTKPSFGDFGMIRRWINYTNRV